MKATLYCEVISLKADANLTLRINSEQKAKAKAKAEKEGYSLAYLVKCFLAGYLSGDIVADMVIGPRK